MAAEARARPPEEVRSMAVISGFHVDDYCVPAFTDAVKMLLERLAAEKVTDLLDIAPGDFIARVPPKILGEGAKRLRPVPVFEIKSVGSDFDEEGNLVRGEQSEFLYFEASVCYALDLNSDEPRFEESSEPVVGAINCFDAREIGQVKDKHGNLPEELKGILYKLPDPGVRPT
jgi:hypothetical protein